MKEYLKTKFTSRKFIACLAGVVTGLGLILSQNTVEGATTVVVSVISYLAAEGLIDAAAVKNTLGGGDADSNVGKSELKASEPQNQIKTEV